MKYTKKIIGLLSLFILTSCSKEVEQPYIKVDKINYSLLTEVGAFPDKIFYLKGLDSLEEKELNNDGAKELTKLGFGYSYKKSLFQSTFGAPATLVKYNFDDNGVPIEQGKFVDVTSSAFAKIVFVGDTEAYAHNVGKGSYKIVKFNPTTMNITGEINLEKLKNPEAKYIGLQGMEYKDGKLYVGVIYSNRAYMLPAAFDGISVAIIDLTKMEVSGIITDKRASNLFGAVKSFKKDEKGDLYILAQGTLTSPNCLLRIKKGEDKFDEDYFVNLKEKIGFCKNIMFCGSGKMLLMKLENHDDFWEMKGPSYKYCKFDYVNKEYLGYLKGVPISYEAGSLLKKDKDGYILNSSQKEGAILFRFDEKTESVSEITKVNSKVKSLHIY